LCNNSGATGQESEGDGVVEEEKPVIGFWGGFAWLLGMTLIIALLSEYVVGTIQVTHQTFS
jgi:Ca2+:H+ antiporter